MAHGNHEHGDEIFLGLLLCAKTKVAKVRLASYFAEGAINAAKKRDKSEFSEERKISKFYRALVTGILDDDEVVVTQPIGLVHYPGVAEGLYAACSSGKPAMSKVCVLERLAHQNHTLVQVMRDLCNLFLETAGITYMHIGWFFATQQPIR
ncbi:unnamed protein product [Miscanthus lutarioriparius]|uniref:Uncharacterized protein n=1 Tax=Miscanthus lutarioriparius TaxID=422564 RepID=A0A811MTS5_9POAL|nr:unnamed protein product [Miscanthus lutarioriparius]